MRIIREKYYCLLSFYLVWDYIRVNRLNKALVQGLVTFVISFSGFKFTIEGIKFYEIFLKISKNNVNEKGFSKNRNNSFILALISTLFLFHLFYVI